MKSVNRIDVPVTRSAPEDDRLQQFLNHVIGEQVDNYLNRLSMTAVQLKTVSEIAAFQSGLLKQHTEIKKQTDLIAASKIQIAQTKRKLTLEKKEQAAQVEALLTREKQSATPSRSKK